MGEVGEQIADRAVEQHDRDAGQQHERHSQRDADDCRPGPPDRKALHVSGAFTGAASKGRLEDRKETSVPRATFSASVTLGSAQHDEGEDEGRDRERQQKG